MTTTARKAFEQYADQYDNYGDEWQDMGVDEHFIAGYYAGFEAARAQGGEALQYIRECRYGNAFPCNPCCEDFGYCSTKKLATTPPADKPEGEWVNLPDMFWLADNNEEMRGFNEWEFADSVAQDMDEGETKEVRVQLAKSLPDRWMLVSVDNEGEAHWGWVKRPAAPDMGGEK